MSTKLLTLRLNEDEFAALKRMTLARLDFLDSQGEIDSDEYQATRQIWDELVLVQERQLLVSIRSDIAKMKRIFFK